jgi:hypothetical protein
VLRTDRATSALGRKQTVQQPKKIKPSSLWAPVVELFFSTSFEPDWSFVLLFELGGIRRVRDE